MLFPCFPLRHRSILASRSTRLGLSVASAMFYTGTWIDIRVLYNTFMKGGGGRCTRGKGRAGGHSRGRDKHAETGKSKLITGDDVVRIDAAVCGPTSDLQRRESSIDDVVPWQWRTRNLIRLRREKLLPSRQKRCCYCVFDAKEVELCCRNQLLNVTVESDSLGKMETCRVVLVIGTSILRSWMQNENFCNFWYLKQNLYHDPLFTYIYILIFNKSF